MTEIESVYVVWCPTLGARESRMDVPAFSEHDAVTEWADMYDNVHGYHEILGSPGAVVFVQSPNGEVTRWGVNGIMAPLYTAVRIEEDKHGGVDHDRR